MIFKKLLHFWNKTEEVFLIFGMSTMFIAMIAQVVCRYCFNSPLIWSEVYARYMYMWVVFLGISYGFRHDKHIYVGILYDRFPEKIYHGCTDTLRRGILSAAYESESERSADSKRDCLLVSTDWVYNCNNPAADGRCIYCSSDVRD